MVESKSDSRNLNSAALELRTRRIDSDKNVTEEARLPPFLSCVRLLDRGDNKPVPCPRAI